MTFDFGNTSRGMFMYLFCNVCSRLNIHKELTDKTRLFIINVLEFTHSCLITPGDQYVW